MGAIRFKAEIEITCERCYTSTFTPGTIYLNGDVDVESVPGTSNIATQDVELPAGWNLYMHTQVYCPKCLDKQSQQDKREEINKKSRERYQRHRRKPCFGTKK